MEFKTVQAKRVKTNENGFKGIKTEIYKGNELFCIFPPEQTQPHKNLKTISLNCWKYKIEWI